MSTEENKALVHRLYEAFNKSGTAAFDQYFGPCLV